MRILKNYFNSDKYDLLVYSRTLPRKKKKRYKKKIEEHCFVLAFTRDLCEKGVELQKLKSDAKGIMDSFKETFNTK
jgi:hypothetical protein